MKNIIGIFVILTLAFISCNKECKIQNPKDLSYNGCGNFLIYDKVVVNGNTNSYILIQVIREELILNNDFSSFNIPENSSITVVIEELNKVGNNYCTDAIDPEIEIIKTWEIKTSAVEIRIVREKSDCDNTYVVDVILKNAIFIDTEANEFSVNYKEFKNVLVNYIIG